MENRSLYPIEGEVPEELTPVPFGVGRLARHGTDVTVVAASLMVHEAERAADLLARQGVSVEVVDVRSIPPLDEDLICESVARTGPRRRRRHELGALRLLRRGRRRDRRTHPRRTARPHPPDHAPRLPRPGVLAAGGSPPHPSAAKIT